MENACRELSSRVDTVIAWAETKFFNLYTPSDYRPRNTALFYANLLDRYNDGYSGPGRCSE